MRGMTNDGRDEKDGMDPGDDDALWTLLGRQPAPTRPSPYFARRVLREVALAKQSRASGWRTWVRQRMQEAVFSWRTILCSGAFSAACVAVFLLVNRPASTVPQANPSRQAAVSAELVPADASAAMVRTTVPLHDSMPVKEVEVIAALDNILQREENRLWTEDTARF